MALRHDPRLGRDPLDPPRWALGPPPTVLVTVDAGRLGAYGDGRRSSDLRSGGLRRSDAGGAAGLPCPTNCCAARYR
jgi:hypothetical protein